MIDKKVLILILVLALCFTFASCVENDHKCDHVDADDDYNCDNCGEHFDDGDEGTGDIETPVAITVTFKVVLDDGSAVSGVKFTLVRGNNNIELVSGDDGSVKAELETGVYSVSFDYDTLPEYCLPDTFGVKIEEGTKESELVIVNNTPDGSARKPFPISEDKTEITLSAGDELYYYYRGSSVKYLSVDNDGIAVIFKGESYSTATGNLPLTITPQIGEESVFSLKNTTEGEVSFTLTLESPLGSYENPYDLTENGATATVNCETVIYYNWIATKDGVLTVSSDDERNNILVRKVLENDVPVDRQTNGALSVTMEVKAGDLITVGLSALEATKNHENQEYDIEISFTLSID